MRQRHEREAEAAREPGVVRARAEVDALRRIELVPVDEHDADSWERLPAPAPGRTGCVRTEFDLDLETEAITLARERFCDVALRSPSFVDLRLP